MGPGQVVLAIILSMSASVIQDIVAQILCGGDWQCRPQQG